MAGLKEYKPYEHYEDAYAVWYKKKPTHWKCEKFKYYFSEKSKQNAVHLKAGAISFGEVIYKDENNLSIDTKSSYQEVLAGEFVINPLNLNFDLKSLRTALSKINVVVSTGYIILRINGLLNPQYARWLLHQFDVAHMKTLGSGVRQTINYNDIGNSFFCRPSLEEQKKIAAFLDYKSIKIERLIRKQLNLIELLKEKRQAVISHAVTKGLNPDAPMKDSGVEWLGQVPTHWSISKVRYCFLFDKGLTITKENLQDEGIPCINYGEIHSRYGFEINPNIHKLKYVNKAHLKNDNNSLLIKGDIIFADTSEDVEGAGNFSQLTTESSIFAGYHTIIARPIDRQNYRFLAYLFDCQELRSQIKHAVKGVKVFSITQAILRGLSIWLPPKNEQEYISKLLDNQTATIDTLIQKQLQQIDLLKERRTALIAAAVTGKIDLRDWTPPANSAEASLTAEETTA
ncbi:restriction endonuclease subunit S [Enterobacter roggenkampii]|uniref:restriction endonuclease subunit S n=1 Tax=Enterobacter roggenkampii TaxID=1812935 RepID=UPI002FF5D21B